MGNIASIITAATDRVAGLGEGLLEGIDQSKAARMPDGINANHPVFVYGHLSIYPQMVMEMLGQDAGEARVPENYTELFQHGVECQDDVEGTLYPSLDEVVDHFNKAFRTMVDWVNTLDDETFIKDIENNERFREVFGTNGGMISFLMHDHPMFHFGQVSTWRRAMGLGLAM